MNITHMNEGRKVALEVDGCTLILGNMLIDLNEEQEDTERVLSVFIDDGGQLSFEGDIYAAVIIIPPRRYADEEITEMVDGEEIVRAVSMPQPCQAGAVTLQLWAPPKKTATNEDEE